MSKYSNDFKLKVVEFYLKENRGIRYVADYFNISSKESIYFLYFALTYVALIYKKIFFMKIHFLLYFIILLQITDTIFWKTIKLKI